MQPAKKGSTSVSVNWPKMYSTPYARVITMTGSASSSIFQFKSPSILGLFWTPPLPTHAGLCILASRLMTN